MASTSDDGAGDMAVDAGMRFCETVDEQSSCCRAPQSTGDVLACQWDPNHTGVIGVWYSTNTFRCVGCTPASAAASDVR